MKYIYFFLLAILLSGCQMISFFDYMATASGDIDSELYLKANGHDLHDFGDLGLETFEEIAQYIDSNIVYASDDPEKDIWNDPYKTMSDGYGDCDDFAILFVNIAYYEMNIKMGVSAVMVYLFQDRAIEEGGTVNHLVPYYSGELYSAYSGALIDDYNPRYVFTFEEIFSQ